MGDGGTPAGYYKFCINSDVPGTPPQNRFLDRILGMTHDIRPGLTRQSCRVVALATGRHVVHRASGHRGYHDTSRAGQGAEALPTVQTRKRGSSPMSGATVPPTCHSLAQILAGRQRCSTNV